RLQVVEREISGVELKGLHGLPAGEDEGGLAKIGARRRRALPRSRRGIRRFDMQMTLVRRATRTARALAGVALATLGAGLAPAARADVAPWSAVAAPEWTAMFVR